MCRSCQFLFHIPNLNKGGAGNLVRHKCKETSLVPTGALFTNPIDCFHTAQKSGFTPAKIVSEKLRLQNLVFQRDESLTYTLNEKGSSHVWRRFVLVYENEAYSKYAMCMHCHYLYYIPNITRTGTSSLVRHKCKTTALPTGDQYTMPLDMKIVIEPSSPVDHYGQEIDYTPAKISRERLRIQELISQNDDLLTFRLNKNGKCFIWQKFVLVYENEEYSRFVMCRNCPVLYYIPNLKESRTSTLGRHICKESDPIQPTSNALQSLEYTSSRSVIAETLGFIQRLEYNQEETADEKFRLQILISRGDESISCKSKGKGKDKIWQKFVFVFEDDEYSRFVMCSDCKDLYYMPEPHKSATTTLEKHECNGMQVAYEPEVLLVTEEEDGKSDLNDDLTASQFRYDLNICFQAGKLSRQELDSVEGFGLGTDIWKQDSRKTSFATITLYYIKDFVFKSRNLSTRKMDFDPEQADENSCVFYMQVLNEFQINKNKIKGITSDNARIKVAADSGEDGTSYSCMAYNLHQVVLASFEESNSGLHELIKRTFRNAKRIVSYLKHTGHAKKLDIVPNQDTPNKWHSKLFMLENILNQYDSIAFLMATGEGTTMGLSNAGVLRHCSKSMLEELVAILRKFKEITDYLCIDSGPTLHMVVPSLLKLKDFCKARDSEKESIVQLKNFLRDQIKILINDEEKVTIDHYAAMALVPSLRRLQKINHSAKAEVVHNYIVERLSQIHCRRVAANAREDRSARQSSRGQRLEENDDSSLEEELDLDSDEPETEFQNYMDMDAPKIDKNFDILRFWKNQENNFPLLSAFSIELLCIPATSASISRRIFENQASNFIQDDSD